MITYSNKLRSIQPEIMDSFDLKGDEMEALLTDLKRVNLLLGGNAVTLNGIKKLFKPDKNDIATIVDVGCGDGELLRLCARHARKNNWNCVFIGIDANEHILKTARMRSKDFPEIQYKKINVLSEEIKTIKADIFLCTLFLHHFKNETIIQILKVLLLQAKTGVIVNDLHRSKTAFNLFRIFSAIFIKTRIAKHDGLVSVARGFKKYELKKISESIPAKEHFIQWKWAFRFQWILKK